VPFKFTGKLDKVMIDLKRNIRSPRAFRIGKMKDRIASSLAATIPLGCNLEPCLRLQTVLRRATILMMLLERMAWHERVCVRSPRKER